MSSKSSKSTTSSSGIFSYPTWVTFSSGFPLGETVLLEEGPLTVTVRCEEDDLFLDATLTNHGDTPLSCYGTPDETNGNINITLEPGETHDLGEIYFILDLPAGNNHDESAIYCSNGFHWGLDFERTIGTVEPGDGFGDVFGADAEWCHMAGIFFIAH